MKGKAEDKIEPSPLWNIVCDKIKNVVSKVKSESERMPDALVPVSGYIGVNILAFRLRPDMERIAIEGLDSFLHTPFINNFPELKQLASSLSDEARLQIQNIMLNMDSLKPLAIVGSIVTVGAGMYIRGQQRHKDYLDAPWEISARQAADTTVAPETADKLQFVEQGGSNQPNAIVNPLEVDAERAFSKIFSINFV